MKPQLGSAPHLLNGPDDHTTRPTTGDTIVRAHISDDHSGYSINCPECGTDVADTRRSHCIDAQYIVDDVAVLDDEIPVYGWKCNRCHIIMPADPSTRSPRPADVGPADGWLAVEAHLQTGSGYVLVPQREVFIL